MYMDVYVCVLYICVFTLQFVFVYLQGAMEDKKTKLPSLNHEGWQIKLYNVDWRHCVSKLNFVQLILVINWWWGMKQHKLFELIRKIVPKFIHYGDAIWTPSCHKWRISRLFVQQLVNTNNKDSIRGPFCRSSVRIAFHQCTFLFWTVYCKIWERYIAGFVSFVF